MANADLTIRKARRVLDTTISQFRQSYSGQGGSPGNQLPGRLAGPTAPTSTGDCGASEG